MVTGFGYDHDDAWATNIELFKEFTDISRVTHSLVFLVIREVTLQYALSMNCGLYFSPIFLKNLLLAFVMQGVRRLGAAAVDMCHVALGIVEAYWEYRLKPWDMAAGVLVISSLIDNVSLYICFSSLFLLLCEWTSFGVSI